MAKHTSAIISGMGVGMSILQALVEKGRRRGITDDDFHRLATPEGDATLAKMLDAMAVIPTPNLKRDMRRDGWKLLEHTPRRLTSASNLEGVAFLKAGESYILGEEMVRRARIESDTNWSQEDAEYLLEHQEEIPAELRNFYLVFTATVWEDSSGRRLVACLFWIGEPWCLSFVRLDDGWYNYFRLPRPSK
jgi:hypothetical protein